MIEITDLYKYFGTRRAIGPLSATIDQGQIVGLLGLNGAGKTTTLRILACDLLATSGSVRIDGTDVVEAQDRVRQRIGYLPDRPPLYDEMRVHEYLCFSARLRGLKGKEATERVGAVEEQTSLTEYRDDVIAGLSHGFRQRVGIAQAIVHRPALVVMDEPIAGLDPAQIVEMRKLVRSLGQEHTVVVSSHILSEISETCDRILVIRDGCVAAAGSERELTEQLLRGMRIHVTVRKRGCADPGGEAAAKLGAMPCVERADRRPPAELGDGTATLVVQASEDVRSALAQTLVSAGFELLELGRSTRELESVFLELSGAQTHEPDAAPDSAVAAKESADKEGGEA